MNDFEEILDLLEEENPSEGIEKAKNYLDKNNLEDERHSKLTYGLAAGNFKVGKYDQALKWLKESDSQKRWMLRGFCYLQRQDPERAIKAFKNSAEKLPETNKEARLMAAQSMALAENFDQSRNQLENLLDEDLADEMEAEIYLNLGLVDLEDEALSDARDRLQKTVDEYEDTSFAIQAAYHLVIVLEKKGQIEPALEQLNWLEDRAQDSEIQNALDQLRSRLMKQKEDRSSQLREYEI